MIATISKRPRWTRLIVSTFVLIAVPLVTLAADAGKPITKPKPKFAGKSANPNAKKADTAKASKGLKIIEAVRELRAAVEVADKPETKEPTSPALTNRPKKVVTPPTLTAAALDALLDKSLSATKAPVSPITNDEEFVRRIYLDVTGKLPSIDQMRAFVQSKDKEKRAKLIDTLLKSEAYAANWSRYWRDVIAYRAVNENPVQINYPMFETWLAGELAKNVPWDGITTQILTAKGQNNESGATAFTLAQESKSIELAGEVSRIFMGVQIQCAQCHDHPNDPWKREQFHEFAAFFDGLRQRRVEKAEPGKPPVFAVVSLNRVPSYTMPDLKDPSKLHPINPKFFLAEDATSVAGLKPDQRRQLAASYITGQDNPWFAKAFVNRVWGSLMGEGFVNPIDDLGPTKEVHNPEVLELLASEWQKGGYDIHWLFRTILNTKTYQRESRSTNSAAGRTAFAANCASRLRADQIFDALAQSLGLPVETFARPRGNAMNRAKKQELAKTLAGQPKVVQQIVATAVALRNNPRTKFNKTFGVDPSTPGDEVLGTIPQALFLMNSPAVNNGLKASGNSMLGEMLRATPDNRAVLESLYLRTLARRPNAKEVQVCGRYVESVGNRVEAFEDILWSLLNSTEFISRR